MRDNLLYYLEYYMNVLIALCGFDGSAGNDVVGWFVVGIALLLVVAAFYLGISSTLWPGETNPNHIKYRILDEQDLSAEEVPHAH